MVESEDADDESEDVNKEEGKSSVLWVDQYAPKRYTDLLSDDVSNGHTCSRVLKPRVRVRVRVPSVESESRVMWVESESESRVTKVTYKIQTTKENFICQGSKFSEKILEIREELKVKLGSTLFKYFLTISDLYNVAKIANLPLLVVEIRFVLNIKL